jgi:hypothetical protein
MDTMDEPLNNRLGEECLTLTNKPEVIILVMCDPSMNQL